MKLSSINKLTILSLGLSLSQLSLANTPLSQGRQWLLGDWNGERQSLEEKGYKFNLGFQSESATNLDGGYNDDREMLHAYQLTLASLFDFEKIAGWKNTQASVMITKRDGQGLSAERISDPRAAQFSNVQEIYGRGQSWRLTQAWIKSGFLENTLQFKIGRMGLSEDFNASHCEFQNLMLCGGQLGKTVGNIWYNGPVSQWGTNMRYQFLPEWSIAAGIYEMNPENTFEDRGFNLGIDDAEGGLIPVELVWKPKLAMFNGLAGEYKVGAFYATADATDVKSNPQGQIAVAAADRKIHHYKQSVWLNAQQQLTAHENDSKRGLYASANFTWNDKATTTVESSQQLAFWYKGIGDARPNDSIGLGFARFDVNDRVRDRQQYNNDLNNFTAVDYSNPMYNPIQNDELNIELNYSFNWSPAIMLRPNLQYVHQAGGVKQVDDAWVFGLTTRFNF
ncbi:carbohydrate porin [Acinetobacter sp. Marseille-Q1618]|uniref:carbohydrate porin n=1 Tax=Acinetobacter sp. Marseille-Q1618 TaxID=2697502 RepID=UPI00156DB3AA|nr:carbohydrate porin [Acinetobacter sp. Marseille-Q1618]